MENDTLICELNTENDIFVYQLNMEKETLIYQTKVEKVINRKANAKNNIYLYCYLK